MNGTNTYTYPIAFNRIYCINSTEAAYTYSTNEKKNVYTYFGSNINESKTILRVTANTNATSTACSLVVGS